MPLRDHFHPPLSDRRSWDELHGGWPMMIVAELNRKLPDRYVAVPQVHLCASFEVDVATYDHDADEYEVRVYDTNSGRRLVAAVEIVCPTNKDRPEHRRAFAVKCAALLRENVCVAIVDLVTTRTANLYRDLIELLGVTDPSLPDERPPLYAAACRWVRKEEAGLLEAWSHPLEVGRPLPTLPLWLAASVSVPLELESSYEETCRIIRLR